MKAHNYIVSHDFVCSLMPFIPLPLMVGWFTEFSLNLVYLQLPAEQKPVQTGDLFESINLSSRETEEERNKKKYSDHFQNSLFSGAFFPVQLRLDYLFEVISERDLTQRFKLFHSLRFCFHSPHPAALLTFAVLHTMILMLMMIATLILSYLLHSPHWNVMFWKTKRRLKELKKQKGNLSYFFKMLFSAHIHSHFFLFS